MIAQVDFWIFKNDQNVNAVLMVGTKEGFKIKSAISSEK